MINVTVLKQNGEIASIKVTGHSESAAYGKDLICAGVSCVTTGAANAMDILAHDDCELTCVDNLFQIVVKQLTLNSQLILNTLLIQLQTIEESHGKFIKIHITEV
ncbi:MAG: ribosomal-processing cysteine protease Prp [Erysipelotrichaceae bacterium]|nr:ribosomal-processing cysteine protease Prp [Erysipelotrichaceae bacterium]